MLNLDINTFNMKMFRPILLFIFFFNLNGYSQSDLEAMVKNQFKLKYDLTISEDPISVRNLFLKNQNLVSEYVGFVSNQNRSWYFNYFNLNSMRRSGWNSYVELYDNRFLTWNKWRDDLVLPFGNYMWFKPKYKYIIGSDVSESLQYGIRLANENRYINNQLLLLGKNAIEPSELANKNSKPVRDDVLTILAKNGKKFKVVPNPRRYSSNYIRDFNNNSRNPNNPNNGGIKDTGFYSGSSNVNSNYQNGSTNSVSTVKRSVVSSSGSTSSNATNSSGGTSVVSAAIKQ